MLFYDESGFSTYPPLTYGCAPRGQTCSIAPQPHRQRVNVLGALDQDHALMWTALERPTRQEDVIGFFDRLSAQVGTLPDIVVLDNAGIHRLKAGQCCRRRWARQGLGLFHLLTYSPELNRIEILWKHAKHFWRRPIRLTGIALREEVESLMHDFDSRLTIKFS